jgi:hypothetical protein
MNSVAISMIAALAFILCMHSQLNTQPDPRDRQPLPDPQDQAIDEGPVSALGQVSPPAGFPVQTPIAPSAPDNSWIYRNDTSDILERPATQVPPYDSQPGYYAGAAAIIVPGQASNRGATTVHPFTGIHIATGRALAHLQKPPQLAWHPRKPLIREFPPKL